ncbi:MAG TPA: hypothetical protein VK067_03060 [Pseudogracilibacillus sp.]|nr:hypothetical protein [Pseudogracilibacillus sp.]
MKKRYVLPVIGAVAALGTTLILKNRNSDESTTLMHTMRNAGKPDEVGNLERDQLENAKMVSEGSQFGVQYYSDAKEEVLDEIEEKMTN